MEAIVIDKNPVLSEPPKLQLSRKWIDKKKKAVPVILEKEIDLKEKNCSKEKCGDGGGCCGESSAEEDNGCGNEGGCCKEKSGGSCGNDGACCKEKKTEAPKSSGNVESNLNKEAIKKVIEQTRETAVGKHLQGKAGYLSLDNILLMVGSGLIAIGTMFYVLK